MAPEVTVIVVSWQVRDQLGRCLRAVLASRKVTIDPVVVDNASADGSADVVASTYPTVKLMRNQTNRGFAAAVNQALATSRRTHVLLLNPDVEVEPETIANLVDALDRHPRVGIVGGRLRYPDGRPQPSVKRFPDFFDLFLTLTKVPNLMPGLVARYHAADFDYEREQVVDQVMGSLYLIRRETLDQVGPFDEGFKLWFEEVDFCRRSKLAGWETLYTPTARAVHARGASFAQRSTVDKQRLLRESIRHYVRKHLGRLAASALGPAMLVSGLAAVVIDQLSLVKPKIAEDL